MPILMGLPMKCGGRRRAEQRLVLDREAELPEAAARCHVRHCVRITRCLTQCLPDHGLNHHNASGVSERLNVARCRAHSHGGSRYCKPAGPLRLCPDPACPYRSQQAQAAGAAEGMHMLPISAWRRRYPRLQICQSSFVSCEFRNGRTTINAEIEAVSEAGSAGSRYAISANRCPYLG